MRQQARPGPLSLSHIHSLSLSIDKTALSLSLAQQDVSLGERATIGSQSKQAAMWDPKILRLGNHEESGRTWAHMMLQITPTSTGDSERASERAQEEEDEKEERLRTCWRHHHIPQQLQPSLLDRPTRHGHALPCVSLLFLSFPARRSLALPSSFPFSLYCAQIFSEFPTPSEPRKEQAAVPGSDERAVRRWNWCAWDGEGGNEAKWLCPGQRREGGDEQQSKGKRRLAEERGEREDGWIANKFIRSRVHPSLLSHPTHICSLLSLLQTSGALGTPIPLVSFPFQKDGLSLVITSSFVFSNKKLVSLANWRWNICRKRIANWISSSLVMLIISVWLLMS